MNNITKIAFAGAVVFFTAACSPIQYQTQKAAEYNARLGLEYLQQGSNIMAKSKLLLAVKQSPNNPLVLTSFAYYWEKHGNTLQATKYYQQALQIAPTKGAVLNNYGTFLCRHKKYRQSIKYFLQATQDNNYLHIANAYKNASICAAKIPNKKLAKTYAKAAG